MIFYLTTDEYDCTDNCAIRNFRFIRMVTDAPRYRLRCCAIGRLVRMEKLLPVVPGRMAIASEAIAQSVIIRNYRKRISRMVSACSAFIRLLITKKYNRSPSYGVSTSVVEKRTTNLSNHTNLSVWSLFVKLEKFVVQKYNCGSNKQINERLTAD